ncbi:MAG: ABC transporter substrate-binding protein [Ignavibacteriae bacterium]|nr:ABC transporter substrate-binding protein [Ignavibacteriota bacterium]
MKIGVILPLTGDLSFLGEEMRNGISLAVEDINSKNERKIEITMEDSKMDPKEGVSAVNKLTDVDGVKYVHAFGTPVISAVQPITENKKIVLTGASIAPTILENSNYTLRIFYNLGQSLDKFTEFISQNNYTEIAVIYQSGEAWERQVIKLEESGIKFIRKEKFNMGERDFRTMLLKIKDSKPELIILLAYGSHFPSIFQQLEELNMGNIPVLGGLDFLEVPKESKDLYKNAIFTIPSFNILPAGKSKEFIQEYENKFRTIPTHQAAYAYDTITLLYLGATGTDGTPQRVIDYIKNLGSYEGAIGHIEILPNGDTKGTLSFATYNNGTITLYKG